MSARRRPFRLAKLALVVLPLGLALAGCETFEKLNPFAEKQTPLPGVRKPLFPEGVPGVEFGAAPPQPSNSNIPINAAVNAGDESQAAAQSRQQPAPNQSARGAPPPVKDQSAPGAQPVQPAPAQKAAKTKAGDSDDAWAGTR